MRVVVFGAGRTGARLACTLSHAGHAVAVIDWNASSFLRLPEDFSGETVLGNAMDQDILREAGIEDADAFVATTGGDNRNIMVSQIVRTVFAVPRVISRIKDPFRAHLYKTLGLDVECRTIAGAERILDLTLSPE
jgi:trk system potassium uptake protein